MYRNFSIKWRLVSSISCFILTPFHPAPTPPLPLGLHADILLFFLLISPCEQPWGWDVARGHRFPWASSLRLHTSLINLEVYILSHPICFLLPQIEYTVYIHIASVASANMHYISGQALRLGLVEGKSESVIFLWCTKAKGEFLGCFSK